MKKNSDFKLIKAENNSDQRICWDIYILKSNPNIRISVFEISTLKNDISYVVESNNGRWIECERCDSFGAAKNSAISLNEYCARLANTHDHKIRVFLQKYMCLIKTFNN